MHGANIFTFLTPVISCASFTWVLEFHFFLHVHKLFGKVTAASFVFRCYFLNDFHYSVDLLNYMNWLSGDEQSLFIRNIEAYMT